MLNIVLFVIAFVITLPILATIVMYYILKYLYRNPIKAFHKAINWSTFLYILAVHTLLSYLFSVNYLGYIFVLLLSILTVLIILQWKKYSEINYYKAFKLLWRLSFLLFFTLYIGLVLFGIVKSILV
ncbi:DUF3397 domain-containing protein [Ornithinibacillus sp. 179-J 7C1 HS]|uniref:DUF3397 domain-containing protein n=1 Tax=Ornithinibacillus sp. 179-J 7C1 HS TaxID=3142384 RepID=UPI0039A1D3D1